ncbi:hypothetical protein NAD41_000862 [Salmonella enterica]|nr:hypothetical protein [Salmonella enterica]EKK6596246.1 hypothetical protein [Salmonella enterica]
MPKVLYTQPLGVDGVLDDMVWEPLDNGCYLSPELTEAQSARYLTIPGFREVKLPSAPSEPKAPPVKKAPAKKVIPKPKGGA